MYNFNMPYITNNYSVLPSISTVGQVKDTTPVLDSVGEEGKSSFSDFLSEAMGNTVSTDYATKRTDMGLMLGEVQDLHTVTMAGQEAEIMLQLTVQIRDRMVEAYQEVMRMQI